MQGLILDEHDALYAFKVKLQLAMPLGIFLTFAMIMNPSEPFIIRKSDCWHDFLHLSKQSYNFLIRKVVIKAFLKAIYYQEQRQDAQRLSHNLEVQKQMKNIGIFICRIVLEAHGGQKSQ